ncbi:MAG TPA: YebC/PmpR family DNA-binding transcriptional regulator [Candidatus Moranbacteria bacterium]|nr:YebC/PmpR family DNA-binding transcriptional regulator [Candidatus Moranbacteria bacterium]HRZ33488.1 YebC/PmpR family DNA-binding transcriptional regulator [Candidatus Moranbacteria bacterium]
MSGHSHWAGIKQRKGVNDAKKANVFTKYGRLISIAAKQGGGNPDHNFSLRLAIDQARSVNMPKDTIERAIKKGTGELKDGSEIEEVIYEGYGPGNVAMLIKTATDNRNRTFSEIKSLFTKGGGKLGSEGSVKFMFKQVGSIEILNENRNSDEIEIAAIEAGAEDMAYEKDFIIIYTATTELQNVKESLEKNGIKIEGAGLIYVPLQKIELLPEAKTAYENLWEKLDEHDDVQEIFDNL